MAIFFCSICTQLWKKKALLNKNMYVYSKSVLPAYLLKIVYIFIKKRRIKLQKKKKEEKQF